MKILLLFIRVLSFYVLFYLFVSFITTVLRSLFALWRRGGVASRGEARHPGRAGRETVINAEYEVVE